MLHFGSKQERFLLRHCRTFAGAADILVGDGKILSLCGGEADRCVDLQGKLVVPGLIDIHCHGCLGEESTDSHAAQVRLSHHWAERGTTSWLPTGTTLAVSTLRGAFDCIPETPDGANILGFHSEGPYISQKYIGAQNPAFVRTPNLTDFANLPALRVMTLAPETEGALDYIKANGLISVLGHTDADYDTAMAAFAAGARCVTHLFNAMPPLHHRAPSVLGAAFDSNAYVQVISDGIHLHPAVVRMTYRLFGPERMILISDAIRPAQLPDGDYSSGGLDVIVQNGVARIRNGALAGSSSSLLDCVRHAISFGISPADAFRMASQTPAELLGIPKGRLEVGYDAEFLALTEGYRLTDVFILDK